MSSVRLRRSVVLATRHRAGLPEVAKAAERAGFNRIWCTESVGSDAIVRAQHLLAETTTIEVGTGIAYAFSRSPLSVAIASADLEGIFEGRFVLGLGAGTRGVRRRYGVMDFDHPAPRMAEYAAVVQAALGAERDLHFKGRFYAMDAPGLGLAQSSGSPRLYGAAVQPIMTRAVAAAFDGVALHSLAVQGPAWARQTLPALHLGAKAKGHWPNVAAWVITAVADEEAAARSLAGRQLAFYFSTPTYGTMAAGTPWEDEVTALATAASNGADGDTLTGLVSDDMVQALAVAGSPETVRQRLEAIEEHLGGEGVDELVLQVVQSPSAARTLDDALAVVEACGPGDRSGKEPGGGRA